MPLQELLDFFAKLLEKEQLPAFLCGIFLGCSVVPFLLTLIKGWVVNGIVNELKGRNSYLEAQIRRLNEDKTQVVSNIEGLQSDKDQLEREKAEIEEKIKVKDGQVVAANKDMERISAEKDQRIAQLSEECEKVTSRSEDIRLKLNKERGTRRNLQSMVNSYIKQLDEISNSDGKIWEQEANGRVAPFIPLATRRAAIISVLNLKGGVGKTTLTANLGVALAAQGFRVLLVDLDYQSSLTRMCLKLEDRKSANDSNRFVDNFFAEGGEFEQFRQCVTRRQEPIGIGQIHVAGVGERFAHIENHLQARWVVGTMVEDVRYRLRKGLHSPLLRDYFDVVLIDCPPRWSTGSVNAIACSDYVLIPVLLEDMSAEAVPRILTGLRNFQLNCCPDLNVLGVVGNKASNHQQLIARERAIWTRYQHLSRDAWKAPVRYFEEVLRDHSSTQAPFACLDPGHQFRYENLIRLVREEIPHAYLQPATVHPPAGAPAGGVRA